MIQTIRSTGNVTSIRRIIDIAKTIDVLEPDAAPLTQLTKKLKKKAAINPDFNWLEEQSLVKTTTINYSTGYTSGATSLVVATGTGNQFRVGDVVVEAATNEQLLVTAISTDTLTVTRAYGTVTAASIANAATLVIIGNVNQEFAGARAVLIGDQTPKTNYTQILRTPFGISRTADNSEMYGGRDLKHQRMMQLIEHQKSIERTFFWGQPYEDTTGTFPQRATGGVNYWLATNLTDAGQTITEKSFDDFLRTGFRYGRTTKWLFAAPLLTSAISYWAKGKLRLLTDTDKTYGINIQQYVTPFGLVNIVNCNLFTESALSSGVGFLIDPDSPAYRFLQASDTKLKTNIQNNDADGEKDEYISEVGLEFSQEKKNAKLYNVTNYS